MTSSTEAAYRAYKSSNKAEAYAAIESAEDALGAMGVIDDASEVEQVVTDASDALQEVAEQYREADQAFGGGGSTVSGEIADELENASSELAGWSTSEAEFDSSSVEWCELHQDDDEEVDGASMDEVRETCDDCRDALTTAKSDWSDRIVEEARDALSGVSF